MLFLTCTSASLTFCENRFLLVTGDIVQSLSYHIPLSLLSFSLLLEIPGKALGQSKVIRFQYRGAVEQGMMGGGRVPGGGSGQYRHGLGGCFPRTLSQTSGGYLEDQVQMSPPALL